MTKHDKEKENRPLTRKEEVKQAPDPRIDQDFPGFPAPPASENLINPKTETEKKIARSQPEDGEASPD